VLETRFSKHSNHPSKRKSNKESYTSASDILACIGVIKAFTRLQRGINDGSSR